VTPKALARNILQEAELTRERYMPKLPFDSPRSLRSGRFELIRSMGRRQLSMRRPEVPDLQDREIDDAICSAPKAPRVHDEDRLGAAVDKLQFRHAPLL
jgi:hypothetical protein